MLAKPAAVAYSAGTMSTRYLIRRTFETVERAVPTSAAREWSSIDAGVVDTLEPGPQLGATPVVRTDSDHLIGTWVTYPEFDREVAAFERIDDDTRN